MTRLSAQANRLSPCTRFGLSAIAAINAELHLFKNGEHNSESASNIRCDITSYKNLHSQETSV